MVDDKGYKGKGAGEAAMEVLLNNDDIEVLGVVAVSSDGKDCNGIKLTCSVTREGKVIEGSVNKKGIATRNGKICGDTLSILRGRKDLVIVGIGDPGKTGGTKKKCCKALVFCRTALCLLHLPVPSGESERWYFL